MSREEGKRDDQVQDERQIMDSPLAWIIAAYTVGAAVLEKTLFHLAPGRLSGRRARVQGQI